MSSVGLELLGLSGPDVVASGLVSVHADVEGLPLDEAAVVLAARSFNRVDYVFFRRFGDARSSQAAAFVVDNGDGRLTTSDLADLHHQLWIHGVAPLLYIDNATRIDFLSCARSADFWEATTGAYTYNPAESLHFRPNGVFAFAAEIDNELKDRFSASRLADGTFWEDPRNDQLADHQASAHKELIDAIVSADMELEGGLFPVRRRLLVLFVLVKYLEDRDVFPEDWFSSFANGAQTFLDVLRQGTPERVGRLLGDLQAKFQGDVFSIGDATLSDSEIRTLASLIDARTRNNQRYFWERYSFRHLPVEVISRIYERFVSRSNGAFYTPPVLASLLLDYLLPYDQIIGDERVLDPACGSGVFLVGAYKRLVVAWRSRHAWRTPGVADLKAILLSSVFGVELKSAAVDLAAFSLSLAVCDALVPKVIWEELQFDSLKGKNLITADFFGLILHPETAKPAGWPAEFDAIVGNPPFESKLTDYGEALDKSLEKTRPRVPDHQAAYLFLEQSLELLAGDGRLCMIQPSGLLYNSKPRVFRRRLVADGQITSILDFTSIRKLYDGADTKSVAVLALGKAIKGAKQIVHQMFRRTFSIEQKIVFEIDHYDRHIVPLDVAKENDYVWRLNLLGGGRLLALSERFRGMPTLKSYLNTQERKRGWLCGEGYTTGNKGIEAEYLTDKPLLITRRFTNDVIDRATLGVVDDKLFENTRAKQLFEGPLVLIKEHKTLPAAFWKKGPLAFQDSIVGISAPESDRDALAKFHRTFLGRRGLYRFCVAVHGSKLFVSKASAIQKQDIDALPFPDEGYDFDLSFWEQALVEDVVNYMGDYIRLGQNSAVLRESAERRHIAQYAEFFCRMLRPVYGNLRAAESFHLEGLAGQSFYFGDQPEIDWRAREQHSALMDLIYRHGNEALRTIRVFRYYESNVMLIVKPDRLRYWIRSAAIRDADDTMIDLKDQGF